MSAALVALILIFFQFAMAGNGVLLTLVFMVFVPFHMAFEYVNTLANYEKKRLSIPATRRRRECRIRMHRNLDIVSCLRNFYTI